MCCLKKKKKITIWLHYSFSGSWIHFHPTVRRNRGCVHTCQDYWYLRRRRSALSYQPLCILTARGECQSYPAGSDRGYVMGSYKNVIHDAERSFKYWVWRKKGFQPFPLAPQSIITLSPCLFDPNASQQPQSCQIVEFTRRLKCSWLISSNFTITKKMFAPSIEKAEDKSRTGSLKLKVLHIPNFFHHMQQRPFMYFQNHNTEKKPSLKLLSWHINKNDTFHINNPCWDNDEQLCK